MTASNTRAICYPRAPNTESEFFFLIGQGSGSVLLRRDTNHENTNPNLDEPNEFPLEFVKCL